MTIYNYKAITLAGEIKQGNIEAENEQEAISALQQQGMTLLDIDAKNYFSLAQLWQERKSVNQKDIVIFTQQLATMLNAGLTVERALQLLIALTDHRELKRHLEAVLVEVRDGVALSSALENRSRMVSKLYISMVRSGETGGALASATQHLADYLERAQHLQRGLVSALIYPAILLIMAILSVIVLLTFVVPSFAPMFEELGDNMPGITQVVLGVGDFLQHYWWLLVTFLIIGIMGSRQLLSNANRRLYFHYWLLRQKLWGDIIVKMETARFTRTLGSLLYNGVSILRALALASEVIHNAAFEKDLKKVAEQVKAGRTLTDSMLKIDYFPVLALQMLVVGQETGQLANMLIKIADIYDNEVQVTTDRLLGILVPVLILALSALIAVIVISILLAILSVNDLFG